MSERIPFLFSLGDTRLPTHTHTHEFATLFARLFVLPVDRCQSARMCANKKLLRNAFSQKKKVQKINVGVFIRFYFFQTTNPTSSMLCCQMTEELERSHFFSFLLLLFRPHSIIIHNDRGGGVGKRERGPEEYPFFFSKIPSTDSPTIAASLTLLNLRNIRYDPPPTKKNRKKPIAFNFRRSWVSCNFPFCIVRE